MSVRACVNAIRYVSVLFVCDGLVTVFFVSVSCACYYACFVFVVSFWTDALACRCFRCLFVHKC
jgi:hypothetical protein